MKTNNGLENCASSLWFKICIFWRICSLHKRSLDQMVLKSAIDLHAWLLFYDNCITIIFIMDITIRSVFVYLNYFFWHHTTSDPADCNGSCMMLYHLSFTFSVCIPYWDTFLPPFPYLAINSSKDDKLAINITNSFSLCTWFKSPASSREINKSRRMIFKVAKIRN